MTEAAKQNEPGVFTPNNKNNPFIMNVPDDIQVRFHPLLDYSYAAIQSKTPNLSDFFGFRNQSNIYFAERSEGEVLIMMSGGSECLGFTHPDETIIESLQKKLQARSKRKVKILNLCMNSYTLANEINAYVALAYNLKPDLVITHSGWNDVMYGLLISKEFVKMGLIYNKWQEAWLEKLYGSVKVPVPADSFAAFDATNADMQVDAYWDQIKKYQSIVSANGGKFMLGLQGYNPIIADDNMAAPHRLAHALMARLQVGMTQGYHSIDFSKQRGIRYADSVHTTQDSAEVIAGIYAVYILKTFPELFAGPQ